MQYSADIYTVSRLNNEAQGLLESSFPMIWVEGELSNLARPSSGHLYFSLKDQQAQVACTFFRSHASSLRFKPQDGLHVRVYGQVTLYPLQGRFQLRVERMEETGEGALQRAFEQLKAKLQAEGLFDPRHKRVLPRFPRRIGIITSAQGAALRDIVSILRRRFALLPVLIYPTLVQGHEAAWQLVLALEFAARQHTCDVLILTRGGGSLEDLYAFNDERLARAIFDCPIPIISAVGHEVDFTIADFVADVRAPTPSAAAELVSPDAQHIKAFVHSMEQRLRHALKRSVQTQGIRLQTLNQRLQQQQPHKRLYQQTQRLDELERRLHQALTQRMTRAQNHLAMTVRTLHAVSPLATMARGYSIVWDESGHVVHLASELKPYDKIAVRFAQGQIIAEVIGHTDVS